MSNIENQAEAEAIRISSHQRNGEKDFRERFANFWEAASEDVRAVYDAFISASPVAAGIALDPVNKDGAQGWWVRPDPAHLENHPLHSWWRQSIVAIYLGLKSSIIPKTRT